jgi:3-hydroxyanthranilate 3,4-dioxygenase
VALSAINIPKWVEENKEYLTPPVGNHLMFKDGEFQVMIVRGPNTRRDFHQEPGEELFYQLEGDMTIAILEDGEIYEVILREGEIFMLPSNVIHSPRRPAGTLGLVVERQRTQEEIENVRWMCESCGNQLHLHSQIITDLDTQLGPIMETFWSNDELRTCDKCGTYMEKPTGGPPPVPPLDY